MANPELLTGLGAALSIFLTSAGSAVASVQGGKYAVKGSGILSFAPIVIAGVLAIYGIIIAVILAGKLSQDNDKLDEASGYKHLSAGLAVGLACLASGFGMASFLKEALTLEHGSGEGVASTTMTEPLLSERGTSGNKQVAVTSWRFLMVLVFLEAIGLYGLIVALCLSS